jgi:hypothetical protein
LTTTKERRALPGSGAAGRPAALGDARRWWPAALSGAGIGLGWTVPLLAPLLPCAWFGFLRALARARSVRDAVLLGVAFGAGKDIVGPRFLLVLSRYSPLAVNAWWGQRTFAPWLARMVAVRARELGIPVLRAANNGISGLVASDGTTVAPTALDEPRILTVTLPWSDSPPTLYAAWGCWFPALALVAVAALAARGALRRRRPV